MTFTQLTMLAFYIIVLADSCGGKSAKTIAGEVPTSPSLSFEPADLSSDTRDTPIRLLVSRTGPAIAEEVITPLLERIVLRDSTGKAMEVSADLLPVVEPQPGNLRYIEVTPKDELQADWYTISVDLKGLTIQSAPLVLVNGTVASSRFYPDSFPVVQSVRACLEEDLTWWVELRFSEAANYVPVVVNLDKAPIVAELGQSPCAIQPNFDEKIISEVPTAAEELRYRCEAIAGVKTTEDAMSSDLSLTFGLVDELDATSGIPVRMSLDAVDDGSLSLPVRNAIALSECLQWHLP